MRVVRQLVLFFTIAFALTRAVGGGRMFWPGRIESVILACSGPALAH